MRPRFPGLDTETWEPRSRMGFEPASQPIDIPACTHMEPPRFPGLVGGHANHVGTEVSLQLIHRPAGQELGAQI